ncbi:MAG: carboxypeptidase-like regulatory domain-containing protein, partial [Blastocatellia bacterium]
MMKPASQYFCELIALLLCVCALSVSGIAQSLGSAGTISGTVNDPAGAVIAGATVVIQNSGTGYKRTATTDETGMFRFANVPPNNYQLSVSANGFNPVSQSLAVRTTVPISVDIALALGEVSNTVNVESSTASVENIPTTHVDIDQSLIARLPVRSAGSGLSDVVTFAAPGVVADSNGFFHALGDHAQSTISLDNQPISDQSSKAFSTQPPVNAIQSLEVITGATPAEFGDKTSLVITAITHSGLGQKKPAGNFSTQYGTFGTSTTDATLGYGAEKVGNFIALNFERSGRFLDGPEFAVLHDAGKAASIFDRFDYSPATKDAFHLNLLVARNRFQIPNTYEQQALGQDQQQLVRSMNIAPGYVHIFNPSTVLTVNPYYRMDQIWFYPSANPFSD